MANFGLTDLVVLDPYDPIWQETRSAPGAESIVQNARAAATWEEAIKDCSIILGTSSFHQRPMEHAVVELPNLNKYLSDFHAADPLALVFGSERSGMSNEELARCQTILRIPTESTAPSMNLGQAAGIVLYEMRRSGWDTETLKNQTATAPSQELESLIETLAALGNEKDYPRGQSPADRLGRIRKAFQNAVLPPSTVRFLLSFSRWLRKK